MKRVFLVFTMSLILTLLGCTASKTEATIEKVDILQKSIINLSSLENYTIRITSPSDDIVVIKYADNEKYMIENDEVKNYYELKENQLYQYYNVNETGLSDKDTWYKEKVDRLILIQEVKLFDLTKFNSSMFEKENDLYILKGEYFNLIDNFQYNIKRVELNDSVYSISIRIYSDSYQGFYKVEYLDFNENVIKLPEAIDEIGHFNKYLNEVVNASNFSYYNVFSGATINQEEHKISFIMNHYDENGNASVTLWYEELQNGEYHRYYSLNGLWYKVEIPRLSFPLYNFKSLNMEMFEEIKGTNHFRLKPEYFDDLCINGDITKINNIEFRFTKYGTLFITISGKSDSITFRVNGFNASSVKLPII